MDALTGPSPTALAAADHLLAQLTGTPVRYVNDPVSRSDRQAAGPDPDRATEPPGAIAFARIAAQVCPRCCGPLAVRYTDHATTACPACGWALTPFITQVLATERRVRDAALARRQRWCRATTTLLLLLIMGAVVVGAAAVAGVTGLRRLLPWPLAL